MLLQVAVLSLVFTRAVLFSPELPHPMFLPPLRRESPVCMSSTGLLSWHEQLWGQTRQKPVQWREGLLSLTVSGDTVHQGSCAVLALWWQELRVEIWARSRTGLKPSMCASGGPYQQARVYVSKILFVTLEKKCHRLGTKCSKMSPWGWGAVHRQSTLVFSI